MKGFPARPSLAHAHPPLAPVHAVDLETGETWCGVEALQVHATLTWPPMAGTACPDCQDCSELGS
ncbi:hypothetical protein KSP35_21650 [Aquihabitans sp. G128]|uniref:hypothetical protein n=1 Tax=Aquihabitans sp. G128 TaxID=2849779 RepID=UPI001C2339E9|nr:hypothetical protein [Aquihabitans sp. G128]QXC60891.1 hypothetical protein KSP35_21650 [Aquihabitans sp. G128]